MKTLLMIAAAAAIALPMTANASNGATAKTATVSSLENYTRVAPSDGGAYIELANAYARAGRTGDAATAYRRALQLDNVMMVTANGDAIWSHEIARIALARIPQVAAR